MACITNRQVGYMYYNDLLLMQVDGTTATDLSTYVTGTFTASPAGGLRRSLPAVSLR